MLPDVNDIYLNPYLDSLDESNDDPDLDTYDEDEEPMEDKPCG